MARTLLLVAMVLGSVAFANTRTETFEPCQYWQYDYNTNTYTCRNTAWRLTVYTAQEVQNIVNGLERRIQDLESRLAKVEQKLP